MSRELKLASASIRAHALGFPGAWEDHPWGETVVKVGAKVFVFLGHESQAEWGCSVKLPASGTAALDRPFAEPTGYGLGRSGWVTVRFAEGDRVPLDLLRAWVAESYRAVAPKKLVKELDARAGVAAPKPPPKKPQARRGNAAGRVKPPTGKRPSRKRG